MASTGTFVSMLSFTASTTDGLRRPATMLLKCASEIPRSAAMSTCLVNVWSK